MSMRDVVIKDLLRFVIDNWPLLTDWEKQWINDVRERPGPAWSQKMLSKLEQIATSVKKKLEKEDDGTLPEMRRPDSTHPGEEVQNGGGEPRTDEGDPGGSGVG